MAKIAPKKLAKKAAPKKTVAKKAAPKPTPKKAAPAAKKAGPKLIAQKKTVAPAPKKAAPKAEEKRELSDVDYRKCRKHTHVRLAEMFDDPAKVATIRARIGKAGQTGVFQASELIAYLRKLERDESPWKARRDRLAAGIKLPPGRKPKGTAPKAKTPAKVDAKSTLAAAAAGKLLPPRKPAATPGPAPKKAIGKPLGRPLGKPLAKA